LKRRIVERLLRDTKNELAEGEGLLAQISRGQMEHRLRPVGTIVF
jgi:hypothetical protein